MWKATAQSVAAKTGWNSSNSALMVRYALGTDPQARQEGDDHSHFRPIGVICHHGKAIMGIIVRRVQHTRQQYLQDFPQYAYVKYRNYKHALRRAFQHCQQVRALCVRERRTLHDKREGHRPRQCVGGLVFCADLAQAFDRVPRGRIQEAMQDAGFSADEIAVFTLWHTQSHCSIHHNSHHSQLHTTQGLRQGCTAAPTLFVLYSGLIMKKANFKLGHSWVQKALSAYADDHLLFWKFETVHELERAVEELSYCWQLLEEMEMSISPQRQSSHAEVRLPLLSQRDLRRVSKGVKHSDFAPETGDKTLSHRMKTAQTAYWRLQKIINSRRSLGVQHRLQLWTATVWSTLSYGLGCTGLTSSGYKKLHTFVLKHIRACTGQPAHITRISDKELLQRYNISAPLQTLLCMLRRERDREQQSNITTQLAHSEWRNNIQTQLESLQFGILEVVTGMGVPCDTCGMYF